MESCILVMPSKTQKMHLKNRTILDRHTKTRKRNVCGSSQASYLFYSPNMAEMVGFEPTYRLPDKRISSAPRYDHFDTSPNAPYCNRLALNIQLKALCNNVKVRQTLCFYAILPWHPHRRDNLREQGRNQLMCP